MKRRRSTASSSRRPRRLIVPSSEQEWLQQQGRVYEWDWDRFLEDTTRRYPRPLPSSTVLAALVPSDIPPTNRGVNMPLLRDVMPKEGITADDTNELQPEAALESIDDPQSSTLTKGQHTRYQQLSATSDSSWNETSRKEYSRLRKRVQQEQQLYMQTLEAFWQKHQNRFKVGLESKFARYCAEYAKIFASQWHGPASYGKCCQVISLQQVSKEHFMHNTRKSAFTLDSISSQVVELIQSQEAPTVMDDWQQQTPDFAESAIPSPTLLRDDPRAKEIAKQHGVSIITTQKTLQTLLQLSGSETHWKIPIARENGVVVLDLPIPQRTTPRECVSRGVAEGLFQSLSQSSSKSATVYTLFTLPTTTKSSRPLRVLVRSTRRLLHNDSQREPFAIHVQLEYFHSSRNNCWEESTSYERALWILDKMLDEKTRTFVARVCPERMRVLEWQETGIAHALASTSLQTALDPLHHYEALLHVLCAMETIQDGSHLLSLAPNSSSIMVHTAATSTGDDEKTINVHQELNAADGVDIGTAALRHCARMWKWTEDRIPYTFPINEAAKKAT